MNGTAWYLMGLHNNDQSLRYSLSNDGVSSFRSKRSSAMFPPKMNTLLRSVL